MAFVLQNFIDRRLPAITAGWLNPVDKIKVTYDRTDEEISLGITPANTGYTPGHLSRYANNWAQAFAVSSAMKVPVLVPGGSYTVSAQVVHTGDVEIQRLGPVTITVTGVASPPINSIFKITGKLKSYGAPMVLDGGDLTYLLLHCPTVLPELEGITFKNCTSVAGLFGRNFGGANVNDYSGANGVGHGYMHNCRGENCGTFAFPTGSGNTSDTSYQLLYCSTDASCGDISNVFALNELGYGAVIGGWYKGVASTAPNMTKTGRCEYIGGRYQNMTRGPTIGEESDYVTMVGGISSGMSFSGVSLDARRGDNTVPVVQGKVNWTVEGKPTHAIFAQASGLEISVYHISDGTATSSNNTVRLTDSLNVRLGDISCRNAGGGLLVQAGAGLAPSPGSSAVKSGTWTSDTTSLSPIRTTSNVSSIQMSPTALRTVNADTDLSLLEDSILVDASAGVVDLDVPGTATAENISGKRWKIKVINSTNNVTITRDGGGATAINGGASFTIAAGANYRDVEIESIGGGNYVVTVSV